MEWVFAYHTGVAKANWIDITEKKKFLENARLWKEDKARKIVFFFSKEKAALENSINQM